MGSLGECARPTFIVVFSTINLIEKVRFENKVNPVPNDTTDIEESKKGVFLFAKFSEMLMWTARVRSFRFLRAPIERKLF